MRPLEARAGDLALDHLGEELLDLAIAGDLDVPVVVRNTDAPPGGTPPWLKRAMDLNPNLRTFVATGMFDSLNSCAGNTYLLSQIPPERSSKITFDCYEGGHMMYEDRESRFRLKRDVARFYRP